MNKNDPRASYNQLTKRFMGDSSGSIAMMFGLALIPMVAGAGVAIDYSRASNSRSAFQAAADAAALAGAQARSISDAEAIKIAGRVFEANLALSGYSGKVTPTIEFIGATGLRVVGTKQLANTFLPLVGIKTADVKYHAEANTSPSTTPSGSAAGDEIALVLDNTGSMMNDMQALRDASVAFADKVMTGKTRVSVVPFVTAVNAGPSNLTMSHMDTRADSQWHGIFIRQPNDSKRGSSWYSQVIGEPIGGCNYGGGGSPTGPGPGSGGKGVSLEKDRLLPDDMLRSIFGIGTAHAQSGPVTPNTIPPLSGVMMYSDQAAKTPQNVFVPTGFQVSYLKCHLSGPNKVSHFDLLARMPNARWKGCVEARPEPYDVTDDAPTSGKPDSLFVPYFWPDESDPGGWFSAGFNNYMSDGTMPFGWDQRATGGRTANILKYDGKNMPTLLETAPNTSGPNKACPTELKRLTSDKAIIKNTLQNMQHWNGGGTILLEGLAWGWRTLSPQAPFADGKPYGKDATKTIVFMSDGDNEMGDAPGHEHFSHYTGFGYLQSGRFPNATFKDANTYLDERFLLACENAKKKGIKIITVLFRNTQGNSVNMMRKCASTTADAYFAKDQAALKKAFDGIAGGLATSTTPLKLTR